MVIDNFITISGGGYNDIKKSLKDWIDLYSESLQGGLKFELYKNDQSNYIIKVDNRLDNERFFYLVNYLNYPVDIEYKVNVEGFTTGKDENVLKGKKLMVYISPNDTDFDNVFVITNEKKNYKVDFGGKITEVNETNNFRQPVDILLYNPEIFKTSPGKYSENPKNPEHLLGWFWWNIDKRFKVIFFVFLGLFTILQIYGYYNKKDFEYFIFVFGWGLCSWYLFDYKMLKSDKHYLYCLLISIVFGVYVVLRFQSTGLFLFTALYPLLLLAIQKPTRLIFKSLVKREPVFDTPPPTTKDFVYMLILVGVPLLSYFLIMLMLK